MTMKKPYKIPGNYQWYHYIKVKDDKVVDEIYEYKNDRFVKGYFKNWCENSIRFGEINIIFNIEVVDTPPEEWLDNEIESNNRYLSTLKEETDRLIKLKFKFYSTKSKINKIKERINGQKK